LLYIVTLHYKIVVNKLDCFCWTRCL